MERRFSVRRDELLADAEVPLSLIDELAPRLEKFLQPFVASLESCAHQRNTVCYIQGLVSNLEDKTVEGIAYLHDQERQGLQKFLGQAEWDHRPLQDELVRQVAAEMGEVDAVLVFDPSSFPKKGSFSVGVQRQWCGRLGKVENCQVGTYLAYVSRQEHALIDYRLYLPREWTQDRKRCRKAGVPATVRFQTRHEQILEMLDERGGGLPHAWISGDDELGRSSWFRKQLQHRNESYLLAVPSNTKVRDLTVEPPPYSGRGRHPKAPFVRVEQWAAGRPATAWQTVEVRDAEKGPLVVEVLRGLVQARTEGRPSTVAEQLLVFRERQGDGTWKYDYTLSNASMETVVSEFARVFKAQHRVEESLKRAKSEAGLADYQVRTWNGWHHHQTLSLIATWFLTQEKREGKKKDPGVDSAAGPQGAGAGTESVVGKRRVREDPADDESLAEAKRGSAVLLLPQPQTIAATAV